MECPGLLKNVQNNAINTKTEKTINYKWDIVWSNAALLLGIHIGAAYGFFLRDGLKWQTIVFWKTIIIMNAYGITAGAHRLWSHRSYKANYIAQTILMLFMSFTYQNSIYIWCRDHRLHHMHSETDADPHNAKRGLFFSHMGWLIVRKHSDVKEKGKYVNMSDLESNPLIRFQHRYYVYIILLCSVAFTVFVPYYFFNESLRNTFFVATLYRYAITYHCTWGINSFAHLYGYKPYDVNIGPSENAAMTVFSFGEGFHNYHHTFPWDYRAAEFGNDPTNSTALLIDLFAWLGWVTDRKSVKQEHVDKRIEKTGDLKKKKMMNYLRDTLFVILFIYML